MSTKTLGPERGWIWGSHHRLEKGISASKDAGPQRRGELRDPTSVGEENETFFIRV